MTKYHEIFKISDFRVEDIDTSELQKIMDWLPKNGVMDLNIAEEGLVKTLNAISFCQEIIPKIDLLISTKESEVKKAWSAAALDKASADGVKTAKDKEWFAQADENYIHACNELSIAKAGKKWFENKAENLTNWHFALKTFLRREYDVEKMSNVYGSGNLIKEVSSPAKSHGRGATPPEVGGEFEWDE